MADTTQTLTVRPEHLYQLLEIVRLRDLSDAAFRTLACLYALTWTRHGDDAGPSSITDLAKTRRITKERLEQQLAELTTLELVHITPAIVFTRDEIDPNLEKISIYLPAKSWENYEWPIQENQYIEITVSPQGIVNAQAKDMTIFSGTAQEALDFLQSPDLDDLP